MSMTITFEELDPRMVVLGPNIRTEAEASKDLIDSVRAVGVRVPVAVAEDGEGGHVLIAGQRRRLAAIETGKMLPALIFPAGAAGDDVERITSQWWENHGSQDMTLADEVKAVQELLDLDGIKPAAAAKRLGLKQADVKLASKAAKSEAALAGLASGQLDLEMSAKLAEFDGDPDTQEQLKAKARHGRWAFNHAIEQHQQQAAAQKIADAEADRLRAGGWTVVGGDAEPDWATRLDNLTAGPDDDTPLTEDAHASCPGRYAWVIPYYPDEAHVGHYCDDPKARGHGTRRQSVPGPAAAGPTSEEATAERRRVREGNKEYRAGRVVRVRFLRGLLGGSKVPAGGLDVILAAVASSDMDVQEAMRGAHPVAAMILGLDGAGDPAGDWDREKHKGGRLAEKAMSGASPKRAQVIALACVLAAHEAAMDVHTWRACDTRHHRGGKTLAGAYLTLLAAWGYEPSPIEQHIIDHRKWELPS